MIRTNSTKWILDLIAINVVGSVLIAIYSAYYSFEATLFGVRTTAAVRDFWNTEILIGTIFLVCASALTVITAIARQFKKQIVLKGVVLRKN